jgi:hypothetical protein
MAQTVALQRGTTSVTANGTSSVTLFTQSGGTATRVIVNSLGMTFSPDPNTGQAVVVTLTVTPSGGQTLILGYLRSTSNNRAIQFTPAGSPQNQFYGQPIYAGSPYSLMPNINGNSTSGTGASASNAVGMTYVSNSTGNPQNAISPNFYIGPSDVVAMKGYCPYTSGKSVLSTTMSISYSFTTITES